MLQLATPCLTEVSVESKAKSERECKSLWLGEVGKLGAQGNARMYLDTFGGSI